MTDVQDIRPRAAATLALLCGMNLLPIDARARTTLHDDGYDMALATAPGASPLSMTLSLTPQ